MNETVVANWRLEMLFARLIWPSGLVRERACTTIAQLLVKSEQRNSILEFLLDWLRRQLLESITIYGLLILIRAQQAGWEKTISGHELWSAITQKSILAWLIIREFDPSSSISFVECLNCSVQAPPFFETNNFFDEEVTRFLPPIYRNSSENLDEVLGGLFNAQWKFEWNKLCEETSVALTKRPSYYWTRHSISEKQIIVFDTQMSEVYRSAYLRALARMVTDGLLDPAQAKFLVSSICPVDLGEWKLTPARQQSWWPIIAAPTGKIDTSIGEIWHQIEDLWHQQTINKDGHIWKLAAARGRVSRGEVIYKIEILGLFQRSYGNEQPSSEIIRDWYVSSDMNRARFPRRPYLRFEGTLQRESIDDYTEGFDSWTLIAAAHYGLPLPIPRWQPWRAYQIMVPMPCIVSEQIQCEFNSEALTFHSDGKLVGEWCDWTAGISERRDYGLPSESGNYLLVDSASIDEFTSKTDSTFCWLCCVTRYYEADDYEQATKQIEDFRVIGASQIIRL